MRLRQFDGHHRGFDRKNRKRSREAGVDLDRKQSYLLTENIWNGIDAPNLILGPAADRSSHSLQAVYCDNYMCELPCVTEPNIPTYPLEPRVHYV